MKLSKKLSKTLRELTPKKVVKLVPVFLGGLILLAVIIAVVADVYKGAGRRNESLTMDYERASRGAASLAPPANGSVSESADIGRGAGNIEKDFAPSGDDAEEFEVTRYNARIKTRKLDKTCGVLDELKPLDYVIFENMRAYDDGCSYHFKVKRTHTDEILEIINALNPDELSQQTYTIKEQIEDTTSEIDVLKEQQETIRQILEEAKVSYREVTQLARSSDNAQALADTIRHRVETIERLTERRVRLANRLERLQKRRAEQLDRLNYTFFTVNVTEEKYINWQEVQASWKHSVRELVSTFNSTVQGVTVHLIGFILVAAQFVFYLLLLFFAVKYGWRFVKRNWKK